MRILSILLVDDDKLLLNDLKSLIDWEKHGFNVLTASNGVQALNTYKKYHPDVVLTDIMMPGMDGLELLNNIKAIDSYTSVILLSSYDDFSFAKKGLQLGAEDYVLKNELTPEYMYEKISAVRAHVDQKYDHLFYMLSNTVADFFNEEKLIPMEYLRSDSSLMSFFESKHFYVILEYPVPFFGSASSKNICDELLSVPKKSVSDIYFIEAASEISDHHLLLSMKLKSEVSELQIQAEMASLCRTLFSKNEPICSDIVFIYMTVPLKIQEFREKYRNLLLNKRMFTRSGSGFRMINMSQLKNEKSCEKFALTQEMIIKLVDKGDIKKLRDLSFEFLTQLKDCEGFIPEKFFSETIYGVVCKTADEHAVPRPPQPNVYTYSALLDWMFEQIKELSSSSDEIESSLSEPIRAAVRYISQHYNDPGLSVNDIASFVHLSGSYLCTLFKSETKKKLVSFITETRITNAMLLLRETELPINKIASMCGYTTSQYFSSAFYKYTKMTPKEYRRQ